MPRRILLAAALVVALAASHAAADKVTLTQGNSTVRLETDTHLGDVLWTVDGVRHPVHQTGWFRVGPTGPEAPLATLPQAGRAVLPASARVVYTGPGFTATVVKTLAGGLPGSGRSTLTETITFANTGGGALDLHYFHYMDVDVNTLGNRNTLTVAPTGGAAQTGPSGDAVNVAVTPAANHVEAGLYPTVFNKLSDALPTTLADTLGPISGAPILVDNWDFVDPTFADQWDLTLAPAASATITITQTVNDAVVTAAPTITAPVGAQAAAPNPPTCSWTAVAGAVSYDIDFVGIKQYGCSGTTWTAPVAMTPGRPTMWRVRGRSTTGPGPWSAYGTFTMQGIAVGACTPQTPVGTQAAAPNPPAFTWTAAANATTYDVDVLGGPSVTGVVSPWTPVAGIPGGQMKWYRVRGRNGASVGAWSTYGTFTMPPANITAPTALAPTGTAPNAPNPPAFTWTPAANATSYEVEVFGSGIQAAAASPFTPTTAMPTGAMRLWRVRGRDGVNAGPWSAYKFFTVAPLAIGTPAPLAPTGTVPNTPNPPAFNWTAAASATTYEVQIFGDRTYAVVAPPWTPVLPLKSGLMKWWRVRGRNGPDAGPWSAYATVTVQPLAIGTPVPQQPKGTIPNAQNPPQFIWTDVANATTYEVEIYQDRTYGVTPSTWTPLAPLATGKYFFYRVRGRNHAEAGPWSPYTLFTIQAP